MRKRKMYLSVEDIAELFGLSVSFAYRVVERMNADLESKNYYVILGRVPTRYVEDKIYGLEHVEQYLKEDKAIEVLMKQMAEKQGVNENLKRQDQMKWVGLMIGPYIIGPLIVAFIGLVIKKISEEFTYYFSIISGDSRRIARKKAKKMSKMVDMISSFKDIIDNTKNK